MLWTLHSRERRSLVRDVCAGDEGSFCDFEGEDGNVVRMRKKLRIRERGCVFLCETGEDGELFNSFSCERKELETLPPTWKLELPSGGRLGAVTQPASFNRR